VGINSLPTNVNADTANKTAIITVFGVTFIAIPPEVVVCEKKVEGK
jgi:hypothetical protein